MFIKVLFIGTNTAQSQSLTINGGIFYMIWMWWTVIKVLMIICTPIYYLFVIYFQFIYHCHILFQFTTRLAFYKEQNLSQTPGAVLRFIKSNKFYYVQTIKVPNSKDFGC